MKRGFYVILFLLLGWSAQARTLQDDAQDTGSNNLGWIASPDPDRPYPLLDSLRSAWSVQGDLYTWIAHLDSLRPSSEKGSFDGQPKLTRDSWIVIVLLVLFLMLAISRFIFPADLSVLVVAYFNDMVFSQISKEEAVFNSWPFLFLFGFSSLAIGLFFYLSAIAGLFDLNQEGIQAFLLVSLLILLLFGLKILITRLIGYLFSIQKILKDYIVVLYLSYFNMGMLVLPVALLQAFSPLDAANWLAYITLAWVALAVLIRLGKVAYHLIVNYRFSKFYLFMYLCTLEIAPVLIIVKLLYR